MYLIITGISTHTLMWSVTDKTTLKGVVGKDFNSHAHVERDPIAYLKKSLSINFNSHAHVERDRCLKMLPVLTLHFNSHAHVERDRQNFRY